MSTTDTFPGHRLRWIVYALFVTVAMGGMLGRLFAVNSVDMSRLEQHLKSQGRKDWSRRRPFLSANDRSRWCTIRALVEHGTYAIDHIVSQPNWDTIDMVKHDGQGLASPAADEGHLYSSKPPLLATMMAGQYWLIYHVTNWWNGAPATLGTHPYSIGRLMLVTWNLLPLAGAMLLVALLVERLGRGDWDRLFVMAAATHATFLTTFAVVLNNHLIAAVSATVALACLVRIWQSDVQRGWLFAVAGASAAFTAANELPALSFLAAVAAIVFWRWPMPALTRFLPAAAIVVAGSLGTNYAAHRTLTPAYLHREPPNDWYDFQYVRNGQVRDSYWSKSKVQERGPIDQGEPSKAVYVLHVLVGHHGIFSLTPIWLFSMFGIAMWARSDDSIKRGLAFGIGLVTAACLVFYLFLQLRPDDRNYGGMTSGFRWVFWLSPLWLVAMLPSVEFLGTRGWGRAICLVALCVSALSVAYPTWNPWTHPWLLDFLLELKWVRLGPGP